MPMKGLPTTRLLVMPPSPPKNPGNISDAANTISPMPSEIMANGVPDFLVVTKPKITPNKAPNTPPTRGNSETGSANLPAPIQFIA